MAITCNIGALTYIQHTAASGSLPQTVAMWFRAPDTTNNIEIFSNGNNCQMLLNGSGSDKLQLNDDVGTVVSSSGSYTANAWHHAAYCAQSTTAGNIFLNGTKSSGSAGGGTMGAAITNRIGNSSVATVDVAEFALWSVQLTDAEVSMLALGVSPAFVRPQSLLHYLPCIRNVRDAWRSTTITYSGGSVTDHPRIFYRRSKHAFSPPAPNEVVRSAVSGLSLSHSAAPSELELSAQSSFSLAQSSFPPFNEQSITQTLTLAQSREYNNNAQSALAVSQQARIPEVLRTLEQTIRFRHILRARTGNIASGRYRR